MDNLLTKYILFGVGIFIILIVITVLVMSMSGLAGIYGKVIKTDISIRNNVDNPIHKYDDNVFNGVDVVNTFKLYEDEDDNIEVGFNRWIDLEASNEIEIGVYGNADVRTVYENRFPQLLADMMSGKYATEHPTWPAVPARCNYQQLFKCDVRQDGNKYIIAFSYK